MKLPNAPGHKPQHHDIAVLLDTGHHYTADKQHVRTSRATPAHIGPHTVILAKGHPAMKWMHHARHKTAIHRRIMGRANQHPADLALRLAQSVGTLPPNQQPGSAPIGAGPGMPPPGAMPPMAPMGGAPPPGLPLPPPAMAG